MVAVQLVTNWPVTSQFKKKQASQQKKAEEIFQAEIFERLEKSLPFEAILVKDCLAMQLL